jgi:hypothetical protein
VTPAYRVELIPRWVWVLLVVSVLLLLLVVFSVASVRGQQPITALGGTVQTGDPSDYVTQPAPAVTPETQSPATQPGSIPSGLPASFDYQGRTYQFSNGPVDVTVLTTGQYTDSHIIYHVSGDTPPYEALYLELTANSGKFYKYTPAPTPSG